MPLKGLLIVNAFWKSRSMERMTGMFMRSAEKQGIRLALSDNADTLCRAQAGTLESLDFALLWDKDVRLGRLLEMRGVPVFNAPDAIAVCDDKTLTYLHLLDSGVPMPRTLLCPQTFPGCGYENDRFIDEYAGLLHCPFVVKEGFGSFGQQVYLAQNTDEARRIIGACGAVPILFQQFISESAGRDLRLYMVDGQCVAAMERVNLTGDFRANIAGGGTALPCTPTREETDIAARACERLNLTFAGVDLLRSKDGPLLCEVNSNAHFVALAELTGVTPSDAILSAVRRRVCSAT